MQTKSTWSPGPGVRVLGAKPVNDGWYDRCLQDLPAQGKVVTVKLRLSRWCCPNKKCERRTFADRLPEVVSAHARRTKRVAELVRFFGHSAGGLPGERLMKRLGMPVSDDTILRQLKRRAVLDVKGPLGL